jgi:hypothetical protein
MLLDAGKRTESVFLRLGYPVTYLKDSKSIDQALSEYLKLRSEFANFQGMGENRIANHKVSALYVWTLTNYDACQFFNFDNKDLKNISRVVIVVFIYFVMYGILGINSKDMDSSIQEDIEYCLGKETPTNLEWLCLTMHALCRYRGTSTNIIE